MESAGQRVTGIGDTRQMSINHILDHSFSGFMKQHKTQLLDHRFHRFTKHHRRGNFYHTDSADGIGFNHQK